MQRQNIRDEALPCSSSSPNRKTEKHSIDTALFRTWIAAPRCDGWWQR
jgi:hypothetical protein